MQSNRKTETTYTLILNEEEATWLRGVMQNPLYGQDPTTENEIDAKHRKTFWKAVQSLKVNNLVFPDDIRDFGF